MKHYLDLLIQLCMAFGGNSLFSVSFAHGEIPAIPIEEGRSFKNDAR